MPKVWEVGRATIHPGADAGALIDAAPPFDSKDDFVRTRVEAVLATVGEGSIAQVRGAADIDDAIGAVTASLDGLRVFQLARRASRTSMFGLPGHLFRSRVDYVAVWKRSAHGGRFVGHHSGWEFTEAAMEDWASSDGFRFLGEALKDPQASEGARRASIGAQLLGRAALETRADLKMLGIVSALEAWLLRREQTAQTMRLARHVSWFGCGRDANDLCGRDRPICPYLHLDPTVRKNRDRLKILRKLGKEHIAWECTDWHRIMSWYDTRSGAVHGGDPTAVRAEEADEAEYWVSHHLAGPILDWLYTHREDPIGDLEAELDAVGEPDCWAHMIAALDAPTPPTTPPISG